jgi:L,D-transpeptidase ErfK/SrfK
VLNIAEKRLYYYPPAGPGEKPKVITYPIGVGRMDWKTPLGTTRIVRKQKNPPWYPPESIRAEHAAQGDFLPTRVPPGPDNPLGTRALRLGLPGYLIHGTNNQDGVGSMVSHGCIRLWNEHVENLYEMVPEGTEVTIVDQPIKVGWLAGILFMETHGHLPEDNIPNQFDTADAMALVEKKAGERAELVDPVTVELVVEQASGLVVPVSGIET